MKAVLHGTNILKNIPSEEKLQEESTVESLYAIRKLKALVESCSHGLIEVSDTKNSQGQIYSEKYEIWFNEEEVIALIDDSEPLRPIT